MSSTGMVVAPESTGVQRTDEGIGALIARLATDPTADVNKLEKLLEMHERVTAKQAEQAFNAAMTEAQQQMRPVSADSYNPSTKSRYASYAALDNALRPTYTAHGFGLSFSTEPIDREAEVRVVCLVSHSAGFSRRYHLDMPADGKGAKGGDVMTRTHATGSALSYGMRYLLKMIFNVAVGESDDDGQAAAAAGPKAPPGFEPWWTDLQALADNGTGPMQEAWAKSKPEFKTHVVNQFAKQWNALKVKAQKVSGSRG